MGRTKKNNVTVTVKKELKDDLKRYAKDVCVGAAAYVRDTLTNTAYEAFERYYCDYTPVPGVFPCTYSWKYNEPDGHPKYYVRTFNVLTNKVINKFYENKHGKIIRGGVELIASNMEKNYNIPATTVFENISAGYHGLPASYVNGQLINDAIPDMKPAPNDIVYDKYKELCNDLNTCKEFGIIRAKGDSYTYLQV